MVDICVMILTKFFSNFLFFSLVVLLNSCESFKSVMGLSKPVFEDSVANETPDLVLPPDFNVAPTNKTTNTYSSKLSTDAQNNYSEDNFNQGLNNSVIPEAKNFLAPTINFPSSSSPSDSIEKFRKNSRFTVGEWVYSQSVNNFRDGNIYYKPIYDKGYNFSRRYIPKAFTNDYMNKESVDQNNPGNYSFDGDYQLQSDENVTSETGELPILD